MTDVDVATHGVSVRAGSAARLYSSVGRALLALISAVVTARALGPADKGVLSSALFVVTLLAYACSLGLGEAAVVQVGRRELSIQRALGIAVVPVALATVVGCGLVVGVAGMLGWTTHGGLIPLLVVLVVVNAVGFALVGFVTALGDVTVVAATWFVSTLATVAITVGLVPFLGMTGAVFGAIGGCVVMVLMLGRRLRTAGVRLSVEHDTGRLAAALRFGIPVEGTVVLGAIAERADLLVVLALLGDTHAGAYAVALVVARICVFGAAAIQGAVYPQLARLGRRDAEVLLVRACRVGLVGSLTTALPLALLIAVGLPGIFGQDYQAAVAPGIILTMSGPLVGLQLNVARSAAAIGAPGVYVRSFVASAASMLALDVALIPPFGLVGGALAAFAASAIGVAVGLRWIHSSTDCRLDELVPRKPDLLAVVAVARRPLHLLGQACVLGRLALRRPRLAIVAARVTLDGRTYLSPQNLADLVDAVEDAERRGLDGAIVETGTAWGGSAIVLAAAKSQDRPLLLFDAFGAPPPPSARDGAEVHERYEVIASARARGRFRRGYYGYESELLDDVRDAFDRFGLPPSRNAVTFVSGQYEDTLVLDVPVAVAHIDCDRHDSVALALRTIWPQLVPGGTMVIDDYHVWSGCTAAVDAFLSSHPDAIAVRRSKLHVQRAVDHLAR